MPSNKEDKKETKTKTKKEVPMKKKAPVIERLLTKEDIIDIITDPEGQFYYFDRQDKELAEWVKAFIKANKDYNKMSVEEFKMYLADLEAQQEEQVVKQEVEEVMHLKPETNKIKEVIMQEEKTTRPERRMSEEEVLELYENSFYLYYNTIPAQVAGRIRELTIMYTTKVYINNDGKRVYKPIYQEGRMVSFILLGRTAEQMARWIDNKVAKAESKGRVFKGDTAAFKLMSARFYAEYQKIPSKYREELESVVRKTEGVKSKIWWYIVMGIDVDRYREIKFPKEEDTIKEYLKEAAGEPKAKDKTKAKK